MFRRLTKTRAMIALGAVAALALAAGAYAYFSSTGTGTGQASVGSSSPWSVTFGTTTGTMYPGTGTSVLAYTVKNDSTGHQKLAATTATVVDDGAGNVKDGGTAVPGCLSTWFSVANHSPAAADLAGGGTTTGSADVTMANAGVSQDACQGHHPDVLISAS